MTILNIDTYINAPVEICFDVSRSIALHLDSMQHTGERVVAGRREGLCEAGDTITWEARHFGIRQRLSVVITRLEYPRFFEDKMTKGAFKSMRHEHHFASQNGGTLMKDVFWYEVPAGIFGELFNRLLLKGYMHRLLLQRNATIKATAEAGTGITY